MNDPYKVLNIAPSATDDEVKHAYRELARKYHPDNYHDNPLADLAQEKMKEINEAYEQIQKQRKVNASYSAWQSGSSYGGYGTSRDPLMQRVREAILAGNITLAEQLLNGTAERGAEWNFLMATVAAKRGWVDEARHYYQTACQMDPDNEEYRTSYYAYTNTGGYRPQGYRAPGTMSYSSDDCCSRFCAAWVCSSIFGVPICCCY